MLQGKVKTLFIAAVGALGLVMVTWGAMSGVAKKQTAEMDVLAADFMKRYPPTEKNESASTLETLSVPLGINLLGVKQEIAEPDETRSLQVISEDISDYLDAQKQKEQGPLDPLPESVQSYLNNNQATLTQIQAHLQSQDAPIWHFNADLYADFSYAVPSYLGLLQLRKVLLLKAVSHAQQQQPEQMTAALEATQVLGTVPTQRPDLISYLVSLIALDDSMAVMRHLEGVSPAVSEQLLAVDQQALGIDRLRFENWTSYQALNRMLDDADQSDSAIAPTDIGLAVLPSGALGRPYMAMSSVNTTHIREKGHDDLIGENICSIDIEALNAQTLDALPWWNMLGKIAIPSFMAQWRKGGDRMLSAELTHLIVQAKALAAEQGKWPESLPNLDSQTCPGERWVYEVSPDGEMSLAFSREFDWRSPNPESSTVHLPLSYRAKSHL